MLGARAPRSVPLATSSLWDFRWWGLKPSLESECLRMLEVSDHVQTGLPLAILHSF